MDKYIKRTTQNRPLWEVLEKYHQRVDEWIIPKTLCVLEGFVGCGKTTYALEYFKGKSVFYFSFAQLEENLAERLFADYVNERANTAVSGWADAFSAISRRYRYIIFDDLASVSSYKRFHKAFYDNMFPRQIKLRPFVMLIMEPMGMKAIPADMRVFVRLDYFSVPEVMKLFPKLSAFDTLGLCALSGGIPKILHEYDRQSCFTDNLRDMLKPSSAFCKFMPELLSRCFRKTECYHQILCAIANGNHSVSEIGKFTGYAYNKCDNYIAALISCGFVRAEKVTTKRGSTKTAYAITNSYFRLWHLYIYKNRTQLRLNNKTLTDDIIQSITAKEIHVFHLQKAFALVNGRITNPAFWEVFRIGNATYNPQTISENGFSYTFDAISRKDEKAVYVKVFENPSENCKKDELEKIRKAIFMSNKYYDSHVYIFAKRRFSDYAVKEAADDEAISLVEVARLKY